MKKISIFILALLGIVTSSCDNGFEAVNTDPNNPLEIPAHLLLGGTIRQTQNVTNNVQQGGDMGLCWAQQWSKVQYGNEERYIPRRGSIDNVWDIMYSGVVYDAKVMRTFAQKEGNKNVEAIALVMQANAFQVLTDLYGPIPFSEAGIKNNLKPKYETQQAVYAGINDMLKQANMLFAQNVGDLPATSDLLYAGDLAKWRKLANSLRLKALMRISKATGANTVVPNILSEIQALASSGMLMGSNADSALIKNINTAADGNPIFRGLDGRLEYKVSTVLVAKMQTLSDPRLAVFAKPVGTAFVGNIPGDNSLDYAGKSAIGAFYNRSDLPGVILSYAQVELLLAEAANEGFIAGGNAAAIMHFNNGIASSFEFNGLTATQAATYAAQPNLVFNVTLSGRKIIAEQMWLALYGQGFEAWTEWRRTGFPVLSPVMGAAVPTIPSRLYFASNEVSVNQASYNAAVGMLTGGDKLTSRLWFMN